MNREQSPRELLIIILHDREHLPAVLRELKAVNVPGMTVMDSVGGHTSHSWLEQIGLGGLGQLFKEKSLRQSLVLALMESEHIPAAIAAAERAVGGFGSPNSGILFTVPVNHTVGLYKRPVVERPFDEAKMTATAKSFRDMPASEAAALSKGEPVVVHSEASLKDISQAMLGRSCTQVAAVISREEHLLGLVTLRGLADHLFFDIMPELFFREIHHQEEAEAFGRMANVRNAADFMIEPVAVHGDDPIKEAFRLMHEHDLSGLPVVDDENKVIGFVTLLELLELVLRRDEERVEHE